jgi:hypothetical protein
MLPLAAGIVAASALAAGGLLWLRDPPQKTPVPKVTAPNIPPAHLTEEGMEELPPPLPKGAVELSPDLAKTHAEQLRACGKVIAFVSKCTADNIPLDGNPWSKIGGYSMPLPTLPAQAPGFTLQPNAAVCAVAAEWRTYCTANIYPRQ